MFLPPSLLALISDKVEVGGLAQASIHVDALSTKFRLKLDSSCLASNNFAHFWQLVRRRVDVKFRILLLGSRCRKPTFAVSMPQKNREERLGIRSWVVSASLSKVSQLTLQGLLVVCLNVTF